MRHAICMQGITLYKHVQEFIHFHPPALSTAPTHHCERKEILLGLAFCSLEAPYFCCIREVCVTISQQYLASDQQDCCIRMDHSQCQTDTASLQVYSLLSSWQADMNS